METKTIPVSSLKEGMVVVGNVAYNGSPLPRYAPPVKNKYDVVSVKHVKGGSVFPGFYIVVLSLPGLIESSPESRMIVMRVQEDSWWHVPVDS
jgi:hypothetical protein